MKYPLPRLLLILCCSWVVGVAAKPPKIGVVAIQDRKGHALGHSALDGRLLRLVRSAGFEAVPLRFQPAADLEYTARRAGCGYILYTDVVDVRRTAGSRLANAVSASHKRDLWEAEVEFRIFAGDQVRPLLSTSVTGRNAKSHPGPRTSAAVMPAAISAPAAPASATLSAVDPNLLTDATPAEESGRQRKHKSVAVAAALEREVKLVRERLKHPAEADTPQ